MKFQRVALITIAALFLGGGAFAAVQGTSITATVQDRATNFPDGIRVGWFENTSTTISPARRLGVYSYPLVRWQWDAPAAPTSNSFCNNFKWYMNDSNTTDLTNFSTTVNNYPRSVIFYVNYTDDTSYSTESVNTSITVTGTDIWDETISAVIDCDLTSPALGWIETKKAFKTITAISWVAPETQANAEGWDEYTSNNITFDIGFGKMLGLPYRMHEAAAFGLIDSDGSGGAKPDSSAGTFYPASVTYASSSWDWYGMWKPATAMDGTADFVLYWVITDLERLWPGSDTNRIH